MKCFIVLMASLVSVGCSASGSGKLIGWWSSDLDLKPGDYNYPFRNYAKELTNLSDEDVNRYVVVGNDYSPEDSDLKYKIIDENTIEFSYTWVSFRAEYKLSKDGSTLDVCFINGTCKHLTRTADPNLKTGKHSVPIPYAKVARECMGSVCWDHSKILENNVPIPAPMDMLFSDNFKGGGVNFDLNLGPRPYEGLVLSVGVGSYFIGSDDLDLKSYGFCIQMQVLDYSQTPPTAAALHPCEEVQFFQLHKPYHWEFDYQGKKATFDLELTDNPNE
jgi:hypothetical protein